MFFTGWLLPIIFWIIYDILKSSDGNPGVSHEIMYKCSIL